MTAQITKTAKAALDASLETSSATRPAMTPRAVRLSMVGALLASSAMVPLHAQTFDIGGGPLVVTDFAGPPLNGATEITNGTLTIDTAVVLAPYTGILSDRFGTLAFRKQGTGTVILSGPNTYSGVTEVLAGTLIAASDTALGGSAGGTIVSSGATLGLQGGIITLEPLTLNGNGVGGTGALRNISDTNLVLGAITLGSAATIGSDAGLLRIDGAVNNVGHVLTVTGAGAIDFRGAISGTGGFTKNGTGTTTLSGANTYTGNTIVNSGTLVLTGGAAIADTAGLVVNGGTVNVNATETVGGLSGTGGTINVADGVRLTANQAGNSTFSGSFSGTGVVNNVYFQKSGAGTLTLAGNNTGTGFRRLLVDGGTLQLQGGNAVGDQNILEVSLGTVRLLESETVGALLGLGTGTIDVNGHTLTLAGIGLGVATNDSLNLVGSGVFRIAAPGLSMRMEGAHTFTGLYQISNGTLQLGGTGSASASLLVDGGTLNLIANRTFNAVTLSSGSISGSGILTSTGGFDVRSGNISTALAGGGGLIKSSAGTVTLSGANSYTGVTTISEGTVIAASNTALGSTVGNTVVSSGATLGVQGGIITLEPLTLNGNGVGGTGALLNISNINTVAGAITLGSAARIISASGQMDLLGGITGAGQNLTIGGTGSILVNGNITTGTGSLTKVGSGVLQLQGTNTFTGTLQVDAGSLFLAGGSAIADTGALVVNTGASVGLFNNETIGSLAGGGNVSLSSHTLTTGGNNASTTYSGNLGGTGRLTKTGTGTLTLTGNNTYSGGTTITGGTLQIGNGGTTGTLGSGNVVNNAALVFNRSNDLTIDSVISGTGTLTKQGAGILTLSGANTYTGVTTISEGTLIAASGNALGSTAGNTVVSSGATLGVQGGVTVNEPLTINGNGVAGGGALRSISGNNVFGGVITLGSASGINTDAGDMELTGAINSAGFNLTFGGQGNTLVLGNLNLGTGQLTKDGNGITQLEGTNVHGDVTINGGNLSAFGGAALHDGALVTMNGGNLFIGASETIGGLAGSAPGASVAIASGQRLSVGANNASTTFAGLIFDNGALTKIGTGTLTLTGNNSYSGGTRINEGTIAIGNAGALGSGPVVLAGGSAKLVADFDGRLNNEILPTAGSDVTLAAASGREVTFAGRMTLNDAATLRFGSVDETGTIILALNSSSVFFNGKVSLDGGTVRLGNSLTGLFDGPRADRGGEVNIAAGATLDLAGRNLTINGFLKGAGSIANTLSAATLRIQAAQNFAGSFDTGPNGITLAGSLTGVDTFTKRGSGVLTLASSLNTTGYTGGLTLAEGTLSLQAGLASGFGTIRTTGSVINYAGGITNAAPIAIDSNTTQLQVLTGSATQSGFISELGGARGFEKIGAGSLRLTGANTYTGITTVAAGTLVATTAASLGTAMGGTTVLDGATLAFDGSFSTGEAVTIAGNGIGDSGAMRRIAGDVDITGLVTLAGNARINSDGAPDGDDFSFFGGITGTNVNLTVGGTGRTSINSAINLGTGSVTKDGSGLLALTGSNSFTGGLIVNAGFAQLLNGSALADTAAVTINSPGVLQLFNGETIGSLAGNGTVLLQTNQAFVVGDASSTTFSGVIEEFAATGRLTKQGTGTLTLTGNNTYSGLTTISGGTLQIGNGGTTGSLGTGNVVNNASLVLNRSNDFNVSNAISGTGSVTKLGGGRLTLTGANTFSGGIRLDQGQITVSNNASLGTGTLAMAEGTTLFLGTTNITLANDIVLGSGAGSNINPFNFAGPTTLTGVLSGGQLNVVGGAGRLVLTGGNTYGATTIAGSNVLQIGNGGTTGTLGTGSVINNGTLSFNRSDALTVGNLISGSGSLTKQGAGALTLTGANTYAGGTALNAGRLVVGSNTALGTGTLTTQTGTTVQLGIATSPGVSAGPITLANAITLQGNTEVNLVGTTAAVSTTFNGVYGSTGTTATLGGVISGTGAMAVTGAGVLTLNGNNTYSGGTNVSQALVEVGHANAFGTGSVILGGTAALRNNSGGALTIGNAIIANGIGNTIGGTSNLTLTGNLSGSGNLSKVQGNTLAINGAVNDFAGGLTINGGTVLVNGTMGNAGAAVSVNFGGTLGGTGTIAGGVTVNSGGTLAAGQSPGTMTVGNLTLNTGSNTIFELAEAGVAGGANNDLIRVTGNLALNGGGISVVRGTGFGAGEYTLFEFGTLTGAIGNMTLNAIGGGFAGSLALGTNTVLLNVAGAADQVHWNGSTLAPAGSIVGGSGTWNLVNGNFSNAAGTVSGPWAGNGALAIFGGTAGGGTVTIANDTVLSPSGIIFETNGYTIVGGNAGSGLGLTGPTGIEAAAGVSATIAAPISGTGSITKNGAGTLVLTGNNSYSGGTNILAGTLQVGDGGTAGSLGSGDVLNNASLVFNRADDITLGGVISGSGTLAKQGAGNLVLSGANTFDGLTTVAAGTLTVTSNTALGSTAAGTVVNSGATLALDSSVTLGEAITLNGTGVGGGGALRNVGGSNQLDGLITLASAARINSDSGFLTIAGGISGADHDLTFGGTAFTTILAPITLGTGRIIKDGTSLLSLFGSNAAISELVINAGSVQVGFDGGPVNSALADTAGVTINDGTLIIGASETIGALAGSASAVVTDQGRVTTLTTGTNNTSTLFAGQLADTLSLTKVGSGTLTLTGANTYTGATRIEGGTLALGANDVVSNSSAVQIAGGTLALGTFTDTVASVNLSAGSITGSTGSALTVTGDYTQSGGTLAAGATVNVGTGGVIRLSGATIAGTLIGSGTALGAAIVEGSPATVTGSLQSAGGLLIGNTGTGSLTISEGGMVMSATGAIGSNTSSSGSVSVTGRGSTWTDSGLISVGRFGAGTLAIADGGTVNSFRGVIGNLASSNGTATVTGTGSSWNNSDFIIIGNAGTGNLTISNGASASSGLIGVGVVAGSVGTLTVDGASSTVGVANLIIGSAGTGIAAITNGAVVNSTGGIVAQSLGSGGVVTVDGAGSAWNVANTLTVGALGGGSLAITNGAAVTSAIGQIGLNTGSQGIVVVDGAGSDWQMSGGLLLGGTGNGRLTIANGGTVSAASVSIAASAGGIGTLIFGAAEGSTAVAAGTLTTPTIAMGAGSASIIFNHSSADFALVAAISGNGTLRQLAGTTTLSGASTFTGTTSVLGGSLRVTGSLASDVVVGAASLVNSGMIGGLVTNNGTLTSTGTLGGGLVNAAGASAAISGVLTGAVSNSAALTLTGATSGIGAFTQTASGVFNLGGNSTAIGSLAGAGQVQLGSATLTTGSDNASTLFTGVIAGSGGLTKVGTGTLTLRAAQTFTGLTTVNAGTLWLDAGGSLAGGVINNAGFINEGGGVSGLFVNNGQLSSLVGLSGGLINNAGARAVLAGGINGNITNAGEVVLNPGARGIGSFTQSATGVLDMTRTSTTLGSLAGAGSVLLGAQTLTTGSSNADTSFGGVIAGSGALTKLGSGTFTLTGANTFTGLTTVTAGTLAISSSGALAGDVLNNAVLTNAGTIAGALSNAGTLTNSGTIAGLTGNSGTLTSTGTLGGGLVNAGGARASISGVLTGGVDNAGTLTLTGATTGIGAVTQAATGVFNLGGNSTAIGSLAGAGQLQLGSATLTAGSNNASTLFSGVIAGSGGLAKAGSGTLVLTGANSYTGTTTITGGALQLGDGGTSGSITAAAIINNGALILNRSGAITLANAVSGTGALVQAGTGTTRLTAANTYTGGTLVSAGRLVGDTAALQGAIQNNAVLEFAMPTNGTFAGALAGTGRVEKTGAGILSFAGDGRGLTGPFAVLGGTLRMDGANGGRLDRAVVTLAAGTTLSGSGLIGGLVVEGGALVTPGNSLGVIGVSGDVTFRAASRFLAQVTESGADLITAGGAARLAGTLEVVNLGAAAYRFNTAFNVLEAAGGITGSFDAVTFAGFSPIYRPTLRTTANGLAVVLAPGSLTALAGAGITGNQAAVAARFDAAVAGGFDPQAFFGVYSLPQAQLAAALDQLSGEVHPAMGRAAMRQSRLPREAVLERAAGVALADNPQGNSFGTWAKLMRSWGDVAAAPGTAGQSTDTEGFVIGVDGGTANDARALRFGVYGSYLNTRVAIDARGSAGEIEQAGGGVYTSFAAGGFSLVAGAGAARFDITTNRTVALPGLADSTASTSAGDMAQVFGRIGYRFALGAASLEPFVAADHAWITLDPVLERGGASALTAGRQEYKVAGATTGLALKAPLGKLRLDAEAAARFELGDRAPEALIALAAAPGAATRIGAPRLAGTAFAGRLGAVLPITSRIEVRFDYAGEFSSTDTEHTAQAGLSIRF